MDAGTRTMQGAIKGSFSNLDSIRQPKGRPTKPNIKLKCNYLYRTSMVYYFFVGSYAFLVKRDL